MNPTEKAIDVRHLNKYFRIHRRETNLKNLLVDLIHGRQRNKSKELKVLEDISFSVEKGEFLGIVGRNGSGKSTLLKILAGVYVPTEGVVEVNGRLTPFIELGVGFNPELTGRDNIFLNGALLGFTRKEMIDMYDDIVQFAELEDFMDEKLNNYSSGMQVRLAFSIAIRANSEVLLIDEVLAVGDVKFQKKCYELFKKFKKDGKTIIFVSHSMSQVKEFCDRVVVLNAGKLIFNGNPNKAVEVYERLNEASQEELSEINAIQSDDFSYRRGNRKALITEVRINKKTYKVGGNFKLTFGYKTNKNIGKLFYGLSLYKSDRVQSVYAISGPANPELNRLTIELDEMALAPGSYYVSLGLTNRMDYWDDPYDLMEKYYKFSVKSDKEIEWHNLGPVYMEARIRNES